MPYNHPMRHSPGGEQLFWLLRARIIGANAIRPIGQATVARRRLAS